MPPPPGTGTGVGWSNTRGTPTIPCADGSKCRRGGDCSTARSGVLGVTVIRARCHMIVSPDRLSGRATTSWYRDSCGMVKHPRYDHHTACRWLEVSSQGLLDRSIRGTGCNGYTSTASRDRVTRSLERPFHHRMVPGQLWDGQTPAVRPPYRV